MITIKNNYRTEQNIEDDGVAKAASDDMTQQLKITNFSTNLLQQRCKSQGV